MQKSYGQILNSSFLIGCSSILVIATGIVRTKVFAMVLGPAGIGLLGLYSSLCDVITAFVSFGVVSSGVRQIANAHETRDPDTLRRAVVALTLTAIILGTSGACLLYAISNQVSVWALGNDQHAWAVSVLALVVFLRLLEGSQSAILQGTRRVADLAKSSVGGALLGTLLSIPVVYVMGAAGVAPALLCLGVGATLAAWWYGRQVALSRAAMPLVDLRREIVGLLSLGAAFMLSALLMMASAFAVRKIVADHAGLPAVGYFSAAWTLGGLYAGFILQAMGTDFYPRLIAASDDDVTMARLVNEQTEIGMLLAAPGIVLTIIFAPLMIQVFYSSDFLGAIPILQWLCTGIAIRVITWPMGYVALAKNRKTVFVAVDAAWTILYVGLTAALVSPFGAIGAGMAFVAAYVVHAIVLYPIARQLCDFRWSAENKRIGAAFASSVLISFIAMQLMEPLTSWIVSGTVAVLITVYSTRRLLDLLPPEKLPHTLRQLLRRPAIVGKADV